MTPTRIRAILAAERCRIENGRIEYPDHWSRVSVAQGIEEDFGLPDISEDEMEQCATVADWVSLVEGKMK